MSVISAILTKDFIVVSSDSILNFESEGFRKIDKDSYSKPKFVTYPKLKCIVSYWGLAYIKVNEIKVWETYEWLKKKAADQGNFDTIESFCNTLLVELKTILSSYHLQSPLKHGIGLHIAGFEKVEDQDIPELFLLTNFKSISYDCVGELELSRRTFHDLFNGNPHPLSILEQRKQYYNLLKDGAFSFYNNGDPILFNNFANSFHNAIQIVKIRKILKGGIDKAFFKMLCSKPISDVSKFQKDYYIQNSIVVGGKTHTILMNKDGSLE